jgi:AraC-like DNA-binding protein
VKPALLRVFLRLEFLHGMSCLFYIGKYNNSRITVMNAPSSPRSPVTRLYQPAVGVSPFVRAFILRDTRGSALRGDQLLNRFPASPHCLLIWFLDGEVELLHDAGGQRGTLISGCVASGCHTEPALSRSRGEVRTFMAMFYPDAFHALFGVDLALLQNRSLPVRDVLPPRALELVAAVEAATSETARQAVVERFVMEHARHHRLPAWARIRRMGSGITLGMASAMLGIGPRQLQRLALREAGARLQTLVRLRRGERSFLRAQRMVGKGEPLAMADHALACDYADQSHMARECKAQTGRTPAQLARDVLHEEADWIYRLEFADDEDTPPARST